jgi:acetylornithine/succinyldiaminopimelate/putrescine aminotransferase
MDLTIRQRESRYLFAAERKYPLVVERGEGCYVFDTEGNRYLDAIGGIAVNALGHCHPRITAVLAEQARSLVHTSNLVSHPYQGLLAERLCEWSGLDRAFFVNSGAEAVEAALKLARFHDRQKRRIVALENSFHGRTMGALSLTGQPVFREPFSPYADEIIFVAPNDEDALREAVTNDTSAVVLEPVLGEGGVYPLTDDYLRLARSLTSERGALLVADEVQCGLGRTGRRFAY